MIVFDLDGTLALDHHRSHLLKGDVKYWDEYFNACEHDEPNLPVIGIMRAIHCVTSDEIAIWSGRSKSVWNLTEQWLERHNILHMISEIRMREIDDRTQDTELKIQWLWAARSLGKDVNLVFEDRQRVVDAWRAEGITCLQVAPGAF